MRRRAAVLLAGAAVMFSACAGDGAGLTTTGSDLAIADLSGNWDNGTVLLRVNDAGEYLVTASGSGETEHALMAGFIARDAGHFMFVTGITGDCPGQTGVYEASITDDVLTLTFVEDPCEARAGMFEQPLARAV